MPKAAAFSFIRSTKGATPPAHSVSASAASLPEHSSSPYSSSSSVSLSPGRRYMEDPSAMWAAVTVMTCDGSPSSRATSAVISLVVLAMSIRLSPFFSYSTCPVSASIRTQAVAETSTASATAGMHVSTASAAHSAAKIPRVTESPPHYRMLSVYSRAACLLV